ncbi:MAG: iron-containing alcohol dehydrogenase [Candidatus Thorarchaeota archaeon]|jgi:glycerol-1-phosphate dehydrogenase [NAD(P)+]
MSIVDPHFIVIEKGALSKVDDFLEDYQRPIFVTDDLLYSAYREDVEKLMGQEQTWFLVSEYESEVPPKVLEKDVILGFGGGRSLDTAKLLARDTGLNWISVPTAASHDGIASDVASVSQNGYRYSVKCKSPIGVIADLSIIEKAPATLKLAGIGDIISKASSLGEWLLAHEQRGEPFEKRVYSLVESALESVLQDESLETLVRAEIDSGRAMSVFGSSRPCSGTEHAISHAMDRQCGELHGLQVAFATPFCLYYLREAGYTDYRAEDMHQFLVEREMPAHLEDTGVSESQFLDHVHHGLDIMERRNRYSVLQHLSVDDSDILEILMTLKYHEG